MTPKHKTSIGGQALIEGIVMRGPKGAAMALRLPDKTIEVTKQEETRFSKKHKWASLPMIRGLVAFIESMKYGYKYLMYSADKAGYEEIEDEEPGKIDKWVDEHLGDKAMTVIGIISFVISFFIAFLLFVYLPTWLTDIFDANVTNGVLEAHNLHPLMEGIIKIIVLILYMWGISKTPDIHRVFQYHGAEHKTIFCYENGLDLTVENVLKQKRFHPRCGTSFIAVMVLISIFFSTLLVVIFPGVGQNRPLWIALKILIVPIVMGLGYEFIKYAGRHDNFLVKILSAPGLWMQRITTQEPDSEIVEVGIAAFNAVRTDNPEDDEIR